jgi:hypothetical protein
VAAQRIEEEEDESVAIHVYPLTEGHLSFIDGSPQPP